MSADAAVYRDLARYNQWMNRRLYALAGELSPSDLHADLGAFFGSVFGTLAHILLTDRIWLGRMASGGPGFTALAGAELVHVFDSLAERLHEGFGELTTARAGTDAVILAWADELCPETLTAELHYADSLGNARRHPLWKAATHLFNHQTHHRGQVTTLFMQLGHDPGLTDMIAMPGYLSADA